LQVPPLCVRTELKYISKDGTKELPTERFLPKSELKKFFGSGKIKLEITYYRSKWGKPHNERGSPWIKYRFNRTKSRGVILYGSKLIF